MHNINEETDPQRLVDMKDRKRETRRALNTTPTPELAGHQSFTYTSATTNILHMYNGSVKLSFCSDNASSSELTDTTTKYNIVENGSVYPSNRITHAQLTTDNVNATLPSTVFDVVGHHRCVPNRLPMIDANASPIPSANIPVYRSNCVGLSSHTDPAHPVRR